MLITAILSNILIGGIMRITTTTATIIAAFVNLFKPNIPLIQINLSKFFFSLSSILQSNLYRVLRFKRDSSVLIKNEKRSSIIKMRTGIKSRCADIFILKRFNIRLCYERNIIFSKYFYCFVVVIYADNDICIFSRNRDKRIDIFYIDIILRQELKHV